MFGFFLHLSVYEGRLNEITLLLVEWYDKKYSNRLPMNDRSNWAEKRNLKQIVVK